MNGERVGLGDPRRETASEAGDVPKRACARVACPEVAKHTLTAEYGDRMMAVGPLSPERTPSALDLCDRHRAALTPPAGWQLIAHSVDPIALEEARDRALG